MKIRCTCGAEMNVPDETLTEKTICSECGEVFAALETGELRAVFERRQPLPPYEWLDIPPDQCPPDYYTLLDVAPWEDSEQRIARAVRRRMAALKPFLNDRAAQPAAQRLKQEIEHAAATLCDPYRRDPYVLAEKKRRTRLLQELVDDAVRRDAVGPETVRRLFQRTEELGLRRLLCQQLLEGRGISADLPGRPKTNTFRIVCALLFALACLAFLGYALWHSGWLAEWFQR